MTILEEVFIEEYERANRKIIAFESELATLPKGYIREKTRNGRKYFYLQYRENDTVKSKYLKQDEVENMKRLIERRKEFEAALRIQKKSKKQIERALGKEILNEFTTKGFS